MDTTASLPGLLLVLVLGLTIGALTGYLLAGRHLSRSSKPTPSTADDLATAQRLTDPVIETLTRVERHLAYAEQQRATAHGELREQVRAMGATSEQLRTETQSLVTALRSPSVRGRWGELQLRRVVEVAGLVEHCDFSEQVTTHSDDGILRPDLVVHLAGGKNVVVDAKVPFAGYVEAMNSSDDQLVRERLSAHARHLRNHVDELAAKRYWEQLAPSPELVVLFVPAEPFLAAALDQDPALLEYAFERNVVLATPNTLVALLRTVAYTWRQDALAQNAQQVLALGKELHQRLSVLGGHLTKLGNALSSTVTTYNQAVGSLEGRVLVTARRFTDLKVTEEDLAAPDQIDLAPRRPQAPELVESAADGLDPAPAERKDTPRAAAG